jgi:hypothetical protein
MLMYITIPKTQRIERPSVAAQKSAPLSRGKFEMRATPPALPSRYRRVQSTSFCRASANYWLA